MSPVAGGSTNSAHPLQTTDGYELLGPSCKPTQRLLLTLVARVAIDAVVHVPADARVTEVGRVPAPVTIGALEYRIIVLVLVAGAANPVRIAVIHREERVILRGQVGWHPSCGGVARVAGCRPRRRLVIGVSGVVVVRDVATGTDGGHRGVVVEHVAHGAGNRSRSVIAGQRERSVVVVERGVHPVDRVMAQIAGLRESNRGVVRGVRSREGAHVAIRARRLCCT